MILDAQNLYSDAQALTSTGGSTNLIDHGSDRDMGIGEPLALVVVLDVAADAGNSDETYTVALETDDNSSFSSPTTLASATITRGDAAGSKYVLPVPADTRFERYSRAKYTLGGTTPSLTATAFLQPMSMIQNNTVYADALTIS